MFFSAEALSLEQEDAVKVFGERDVARGGVREVQPVYGAKELRAILEFGLDVGDDYMRDTLVRSGLPKAAQQVLLETRMMTRAPPDSGNHVMIQPRIPGVDLDNLSVYADTEQEFAGQTLFKDGSVVDDRKRVYKLNSVFNDVTLTDSLQLSARRLQSAKRLAVSDPAAAAVMLSDYLRANGRPNTRVVAGDYARSINRARDQVRRVFESFQQRGQNIRRDTFVNSRVTTTHVLMTYDDYGKTEPQWTASGPYKYMNELQMVYHMAACTTPDTILYWLGVETVMLNINILCEATQEYYMGKTYGYSSLKGIKPMSAHFPADLTAEQKAKLFQMSRLVHPVYVDSGSVVGTSVQVTDRHFIFNEHTWTMAVDAGESLSLCGAPISSTRAVGHDICMVKRDGHVGQWSLRCPDVGERVVLCYSVGDSVEYSEILRVTVVKDEHLLLTESNILRRGASGAAVIALRDGALLGIFRSIRAQNVVCSPFTSLSFQDVTDLESITSSEVCFTPGDQLSNRTYEHMRKRGFQGFLESINRATASLYTDTTHGRMMVGTVANWAGDWLTTVDPNLAPLVLARGEQLAFKNKARDQYVGVEPPPVLDRIPNVRQVRPGERVFVFVKSGDDVAMSRVCEVVHFKPDLGEFVVEDFGEGEEVMTGGLIIAERDAAVVGQYVRRSENMFGEASVLCSAWLESRVLPVLGVSAPSGTSGTVDTRVLVLELKQMVDDAETFETLSVVGSQVLSLFAKHSAYTRDLSVVDGDVGVMQRWLESYDGVLQALGWVSTDWMLFAVPDREELARAFLALLYLRDPVGFSTRVLSLLLDPLVSERTPVDGEYPFPRPVSTGTVRDLSFRDSGISDTDQRLRDLENQIVNLTGLIGQKF